MLRFLNVADCTGITGCLPKKIGQCKELQSINMTGCKNMNGEFPISLKDCSSLAFLDCDNCENLTGSLPTLDGCTRLKKAAFAGCRKLSGEMPAEIIKMVQKKKWKKRVLADESEHPQIDLVRGGIGLNLLMECLEFTLPQNWSVCSSLNAINLSGWYELVGEIPAAIGQCEALERLVMTGCSELSGAIPEELGECKKLMLIDFTGCVGLTGPLPLSVAMLPKLVTVKVPESITDVPFKFGTSAFLHSEGKAPEEKSEAERPYFCRHCGKKLPGDGSFCGTCGKDVYK